MPAKRSAPSDSGATKAKKAKTTTPAAAKKAATPKATAPKASGRWSGVSATANVAKGYEEQHADPEKAFAFECMCPPRFERRRGPEWEDEEDEDSEEENDEEDANPPECDGGKTCMCGKKAADHPDYPWIMTSAGEQMYLSQFSLSSYRDPDSFGMYTFNDHYGLGLVEMLQNMILDFKEAADWRVQWAVAEAAVMWLLDSEAAAIGMVPDGDVVQDAYSLVGRMFLSLIARLDRENIVDQAINARVIMALYIKLAQESQENNLLNDYPELEKVGDGIEYAACDFDNYVLAYAKKLGITLSGPKGLDGFIATSPPRWKKYEKDHAGSSPPGSKSTYRGIGGDSYDITTWTPAERKNASFDKKDPIPRSVMDGIKKGLSVRPA